jgi:septum formation protein
VIVSGVDEDAITAADTRTLVGLLAEAKGNAVASRPEVPADAIVIACDSMFELDGHARGKPASADEARARWFEMRGRSGTLFTGHSLVDTATGTTVGTVASTVVHFGDPTDAEIDAYVATDEPMGVAGGFTLDGRSAPFIVGVDGDHANVIGLSLRVLRRLLRDLDVEVTSLWA